MKNKTYLAFFALGILATASVFYSSLIGAKYSPTLGFKILGPDVIFPGENTVVSWEATTENKQRLPEVKIEFCDNQFFVGECLILNPSTPDDGEALVVIPPSINSSNGFIRITGKKPESVSAGISSMRPVKVKKPIPLESGDTIIVSWKPNQKYDYANLEFCVPLVTGLSCTPLASKISNNGTSPIINITKGFLSSGFVRVTSSEKNKLISEQEVTTVTITSPKQNIY